MANKEFNARVKHKRDISANWTKNDPILLDGEIIIVDTADGDVRLKIGNGSSTYTQLPFSDEYIFDDMSKCLKYTSQTLTQDQKVQARANISASEAGHGHTKAGIVDLNKQLKNENLDSITDVGFYFAGGGGNSVTNKPSGVDAFGLIVVLSANGWRTQILYASNNNKKIFIRWYEGSAWSSWEDISVTSATDDVKGIMKLYTSTGTSTDGTMTRKAITNALNGKQASITGAASTITSSNLTADRTLISDSSGKVAASDITSTELGYLDGVTSNIQTQLDGKSASGHTHNYLPLTGGTLSGDLKFNNAQSIHWNGGVYQQKIAIKDDAIENTDVFKFQQSSDSGESFIDLMTIKDNGTVVATNFEGTATKAKQDWSGNDIKGSYAASMSISDHTITLKNKNGASLGTVTVPDNDTKNTAGSTDTSSKIFLVGTTSQAANAQTYSHDTAYVDTDGCLYSNNTKVSVDGHTHNYAGSSSAGGAANSANKLATARTIGISDGATGTATSFDGSGNITIPVTSISPSHISEGYTTNSFYLNTHPENNPVIIPFINNDIAYLLKRGGSAVVKYDGVTQDIDISNVFDGSPDRISIPNTGITEITIELTLHRTFTWGNTIYIDSGSNNYRAKNVKIEVINTNYKNDIWTTKGEVTNYKLSQYKVACSHTPVGGTNNGAGFNKIRITFSNWNASNFRISEIGVINYNSVGVKEICLSRDGGSLYGDIKPHSNNTLSVGSSDKKWANVYATTFNGALSGNASTASKLQNARTISLTGSVTGSGSFDGSGNLSIATTTGHTHTSIAPIVSKTYTGIYGSANDQANGSFYFAGVRPTNFYDVWHVKYRVESSVPNQNNYRGYFEVEYWGAQSTIIAYNIQNNHANTSYRTIYYHNVYRLNSTGYNSNYKHMLGIGLRSSTNPTSSSYPRTFNIDVLEADNCTVSILDSMVKVASVSGYGTTNFTGVQEFDGANNGSRESGDDNNYDRLIAPNDAVIAGTNGIYGTQLIAEDSDGRYQSLTKSRDTGTSHVKNSAGFRIEKLFYNSSSTTYTSGQTGATWSLYKDMSSIDLRYSTNCGTTLTTRKPVYLVGTMSNGLFYLADTWWVQSLPTSDDGKVYKYIGEAIGTSSCSFTNRGDLYWYKNGAVRVFPDTGCYAFKDVPSNAVFTDTNTKVTQTNSTGNASYRLLLSASANNTTETNTSLKSNNFYANPSTGELFAKGYKRNIIDEKTIDINTLTLSSGAPHIMRYIERTSGGAANITNIPVTGNPFLLDVELIRWTSTTDYITRQIFTNAANKENEYVRYCTNGTWSTWTKRVFTDTTYSAIQNSYIDGLFS